MARSREELMQLGIFDLRKIGMDIGVKLPTTFNKAELIEEIILIETKQKEPYVKPTNRGRPSKFVSVAGKLTSNKNIARYDYSKAFGLESCCKNYVPSLSTQKVEGVIDLSTDNNYVLVPTVTNKKHYFVHESIVSQYVLKCGDLVKCEISSNPNDNYVVKVDSVNGCSVVGNEINRVDFEEEIDTFDFNKINVEKGVLQSSLFPIYKGDRVVLSSLESKDRLVNTFKFVKNIANNNDITIYVLLNKTNNKCVSVFSQLKNVKVFASQFTDNIEIQSNLARLYFNSVKNTCETMGKNVVMVIEDVGELYKIYKEQNDEIIAIDKLKNIFIQSKQAKNSSLTVVFSLQKDEVFYNEFLLASSVNLATLDMSEQDICESDYNLIESGRNDIVFALENKLPNLVKKFCKSGNYMERHKKVEQIAQNSTTSQEIYEKLLEIL